MASPSRTASSTPRLSDVARHVVIPEGIVSTSWPRIERRLADMEIRYDSWQAGATQITLGKRRNGKYAATVGGVVWSIPRQVGKTFSLGSLLIAMCVEYPGLHVVWTAHHGRTSTSAFRAMDEMARRKRIRPHIKPGRNRGLAIREANGEQEIPFVNGSLIMFGARERGFGRGIPEIDIMVFDEAQILGEKTLEDMVPTANQARHPHGALIFFIGTPPRPIDNGEAFTNKRARALDGKTTDQVYLEFSADPDADPDDREQWAKANPSYPHRTPVESMLRMRENLGSDEAWRREALGIWDAKATAGVIPAPSWMEQADEQSMATDRQTLGVEVGRDLAWASIALAGQRPDGDWHIEVDDDQHTRGQGVAWLVPALEHLVVNNPQIRAVVADVAGPIKALLEERNGRWWLKGTSEGVRIEITPVKVAELGTACSLVLSGIVTGWLWHIGQPQLSAAALAAGKRALGDTGLWVWNRRGAESDITPIQAGTLALHGAQADKAIRPLRQSGRTGRGRAGRRVVVYG